MSTVNVPIRTSQAEPVTGPAPIQPPLPWRLNFPGLLVSEVRKLTTMASTWVILGLSLVLGMLATSLLNNFITPINIIRSGYDDYDDLFIVQATETLVAAPIFPGAVMMMLGIMAVTNEYSSGMMRTTLTVVPSRWQALTAKAIVVASFAFLTCAVGNFLGLLVFWARSGGAIKFNVFTTDGLIVWLGGALVVALLSLMGLAFGTLLRSAVGAVLVLILGIMLILPFFVLMMIPMGFAGTPDYAMIDLMGQVVMHFPAAASLFVYAGPVMGYEGTIGGFEALLTMLAWTVIPLAGAYWRFIRSDA